MPVLKVASMKQPTTTCKGPQTQGQSARRETTTASVSSNPSGTTLLIIGLASTLVVFQTVVSFLSFFPQLSLGFFRNGVVKVFDMYPVDISPSKLFFVLIPFCQASQVSMVGYTLLSLCRRTASGPRLTNPPVLNIMFYILWSTATTINMIWTFVFDKAFLPEAWVLLVFSLLALVPTYSTAASRLSIFQPALQQQKRFLDLISLRGGVLNSLAMQITQTVVCLFVESTVLVSAGFSGPVVMETLSSVSLGAMLLLTLVYTALDVTVLEAHTRYVLSPYLTMAVSLVSMIQGGWDVLKPSSVLKASVLSSCLLGLVTKTAVSLYNRRKSRTITSRNESENNIIKKCMA